MTRPLEWLRRLDEDASSGRLTSRLVITIPLALFVGCLLGGGVGFVVGVFVGLLPRYRGDYSVIAYPYVGALLGAAVASLLAVWIAVRLCRSRRSSFRGSRRG